MKEIFCEKYFENKVKPKHLKKFEQETPKGHKISGYICRKANQYLGSLVITHITEKSGDSYDVEQFVQSFPKIHYWDDRHRLNEDGGVLYFCDEKFDGTCLIIYSLNDKNGKSLELVPKTRGQAVADQRIQEMYDLIDKKPIEEFFKNNSSNDCLMFELYGVLNKHEITYMDTYIDIVLIGAYVGGKFLDKMNLYSYELEGFFKPVSLFNIVKEINESEYSINWISNDFRIKNYGVDIDSKFPTLYDAIQEIKSILEQINDEFIKRHNRRLVEGVVINGKDSYGKQMYLKIKPKNVEFEKDQMDSVPRRFVLKEAQKYFDEYGSRVLEIYREDEFHYVDYVKRQLKEEFSYEQVEDPRTIKRIRNTFMDVWDSKIPPIGLQEICENLINENPEKSVSDLMKIFARTYPSKKKQSRHVYNILKALEKSN